MRLKTTFLIGKKNIANHITQQDIPDWKDEYWEELDWIKLNPLYLYKHSIQKERGHTWNNYQKLIEYIRKETDHKKATDFQEFVFLTEYNQKPSKNSAQQKDKDKQDSIKKRDEFFRKTDFFQNFPIVIVAAGPYAKQKFGVFLEETFKVKKKEDFRLKRGYWYSLYESSNKLVIHTRQLSNSVADKLLQEIAQKVKDFIKEKNIPF